MLLTKVHIPAPSKNLVQRAHLFDQLNKGLNRKLILISAPAGFGKSTLISDWIYHNNISSAWFSIDSNDNDPVDFLIYIIAAIQQIDKHFGESAMDLLESPNPPAPETIANLLLNEILAVKKDFLLVLDDFHLINNAEIVNLLSYFIEHIPENIHVVILTRSDPAISIARLRSQHQLIELRSADLSFSAPDIATLFNKRLKIKLSNKEVNLLEAKTEGWIAGLQLTALSMNGRSDIPDFVATLKGNNRYIMDYLIEEVLKIQTTEIKEFLISTSILEQISAPLCNAVLEQQNSHKIIEILEKTNMFVIPLDSERKWYRYHHLFADLLKQRLQQKNRQFVEDLHNKACQWFEENNMYELAIDHALEINNYTKAMHLLSTKAESMWKSGHHTAVLNYGDALPDNIVKGNPTFCLYYAWILISSGQITKAETFLQKAEDITKENIIDKNISTEELTEQKKLLGKIAVAFAYLNSNAEHTEKIFDYCHSAMENLSGSDPFWLSWVWFSYGVAYFSKGDLVESNKAFNKGFEYGRKTENIYLISTIAIRMAENEQQLGNYTAAYNKCSELFDLLKKKGYLQLTKGEWTYGALYFIMGVTQYMRADTENAYKNIKIAYSLCKEGSDIYTKAFVLLVYSVMLKEQGDPEANERIEELDRIMDKNEFPSYYTSAHLGWKVYLLTRENKIEQANELVKNYGLSIKGKKDHTNEMAYVAYARLLILQYKLNEAEQIIKELYPLVSAGRRVERMIELKMFHALLHKTKGEKEKAVSLLIEVMELASPENLLSYFVYNNEEIGEITKEVIQHLATRKTKIPKKFVSDLQLALARSERIKNNQQESELSSRELDTLKLIAEDLINQEIADRLFISLNTVKTHVRNILIKLDAENRTQAVSKAKEIGIL